MFEIHRLVDEKQRSHYRKRVDMTDRRQIQHALKYAKALDTIYMLEKYKKYYPNIFNYVEIKTRPATNDDYFVPNNLECLVVESLRFVDKKACDHLGCFPFKNLGEPCTDTDGPQLSSLGNTTTISCQKMCQRSKHIDTEWWGDRCVQVNPLKKLVVMFPERVFGRKDYHKYHNGLDWIKGKIALNTRYCQAYGMEFNGYECTMTWGQQISEALLGTTVYRSAKTHSMPKVTVPPSVKIDLIYQADPIMPEIVTDSEDSTQWVNEIVRDLGIDFGIDIGLHVVQNFLKKRAPRLLLKATTDVGVKKALSAAVMKNSSVMLAKGSIQLAKALGAASIVYTVYSLLGIVVDVIDPNLYSYLLTGKMIKNLNLRLDARYFQQEDNFNREITPDFVWDYVLDLENQSDRILYMAENINIYLQTLNTLPSGVVITEPPSSVNHFQSTQRRDDAIHWNLTMHFVILGMLLVMSMIWKEWVHVWGVLVLLGIFTTQ